MVKDTVAALKGRSLGLARQEAVSNRAISEQPRGSAVLAGSQ